MEKGRRGRKVGKENYREWEGERRNICFAYK